MVITGRSEATSLLVALWVVGRSGLRFPLRRALQLESMGVVHDAIEECVGDGRICDVVVPGLYGQLTGNHRRARAMTVFEDLEHVATLVVPKRRDAPVIEHQDVVLRETTEQAGVGAVGVGKGELFEEPWHSSLRRTISAATRLLGERACDVRFARAGSAGDDHVGV
jgi:hypothetical protein